MRKLVVAGLFLALAAGTYPVLAQQVDDPTGTWTWTIEFNGNSRDLTLNLNFEEGVLTGSMPGPDGTRLSISDASFAEGAVAFTILREWNGQEFSIRYAGVLEGDAIVGETTSMWGDEERSWEWNAKRVEE